MSQLIEDRIANIRQCMSTCDSPIKRYEKIIELGRLLPPLPPHFKEPKFLVPGCQSRLYLHSRIQENHIIFEAEADALIANGLAYLLVAVYSDQPPETILQCRPHYLEELQISASLSLSRANGLAHLYLRMKQDALHLLVVNNTCRPIYETHVGN